MRVGVDARSLKRAESGPGIYTRQLLNRLSGLAPGWTFYLYWGHKEQGTVMPGGSNVIARELGRPGGQKIGNLIFEQLLLPEALIRDKCDLLWSPAFILPLRKSTRQVVTMHDVIPLIFADQESWARRAVYHRLLRINARQADRILTVSQSSANDLVDYLGVDPSRIDVVPNGLEQGFAPLSSSEVSEVPKLLNELGIEHPYILSTAGLLPRKNPHRIMDAFAHLRRELGNDAPASLVLTGGINVGGNNGYLGDLRSRAEAGGVEERVRIIGHLSREQIRLLYCGALFSVNASLYEGFGFPVLESMACGCPVIASNRSSLPEVAGDAALLADPRSIESLSTVMKQVTTDAHLRSRMRSRGLIRARHFSWNDSARRIISIFGETLGEPELKEEFAA